MATISRAELVLGGCWFVGESRMPQLSELDCIVGDVHLSMQKAMSCPLAAAFPSGVWVLARSRNQAEALIADPHSLWHINCYISYDRGT